MGHEYADLLFSFRVDSAVTGQTWIKAGIEYAKTAGFKKRYVLIPALLIVIWLGWIVFFMTFPVEHDLYNKVKINNSVNLYVTQASAGAMTSFSYHYYLYDAKKSDNDFMANVKNEAAFMVTNDDKAIAEVKVGQLYLHVHGKIYSFNNVSNGVRIYLDASPY